MKSFLAALLVCAAAVAAEAVTVVPISFGQLVRESNSIVYARVVEVEGRWTDDRSGIESLVTVDVIEIMKGAARERQRFLLPGGQAGGRVNVIPGAPVLRDGDLVVLFLASSGPSIPRPVGFTQGVLRVSGDPRTGTLVVPAPAGRAGRGARGSAERAPITLADLASRVGVIEAAR